VTKPIKNIIKSIIPPQHQWKIKLFQHWKTIIGSMDQHVSLHQIKGSQIILGVTHPAWAQELHFLSPVLKKKVNKLFNEKKIKTIHFRIVSSIKKKESPQLLKKKSYKLDAKQLTLQAREVKALKTITDEELRTTFKQFLFRCKREKGERNAQ